MMILQSAYQEMRVAIRGPAAQPLADNKWYAELLDNNLTAQAIARRSFNADSDNARGIANVSQEALALFHRTLEAKECARAFREKRRCQPRRVRNRKAQE
jgi:1,4-dihydroxy-2-naphthoyl-CoA synthase